MRVLKWTAILGVAGTLLLGACDDATGPEAQGQVQVLITDAPADYIDKAEVWISHVYLQGGGDQDGEGDGGGRVDLFNDPDNPLYFDLLTLQDGITDDLTDATDVDPGSYAQLRLVVDEALVTLKEGYTFSDDEVQKTLFVPSGMQSGIKVHLAEPIEVAEESLVIVTVDFDVNDNFVLQGNPETPAGIQGILFTPVLKEKGRVEEPTSGG